MDGDGRGDTHDTHTHTLGRVRVRRVGETKAVYTNRGNNANVGHSSKVRSSVHLCVGKVESRS
jgi:hypothetical protein